MVTYGSGKGVSPMAEEPLVTWTRADGTQVDVPLYGVTDVHLRGVPVIVPYKKKPMATRRGKAARRRPNSRVRVTETYAI